MTSHSPETAGTPPELREEVRPDHMTISTVDSIMAEQAEELAYDTAYGPGAYAHDFYGTTMSTGEFAAKYGEPDWRRVGRVLRGALRALTGF